MAMRWKSPIPIDRTTAEIIRLWLLYKHKDEWDIPNPGSLMKIFTLQEDELAEFVNWLNGRKAFREVTVEYFKPFIGFKASVSKKFRNFGVLLDDHEGKLTLRSPMKWLNMYREVLRF